MKSKRLTIQEIADKINYPLSKWPGNCYGISLAIVQAGIYKGKVRYGHYTGNIHKDSMFYKRSAIGFVKHGWIETKNGKIIDPTRWVFECVNPYIYTGINKDEYDIGGSSFRDALRSKEKPPFYDKTDKQIILKGFTDEELQLLHLICNSKRTTNQFSLNQLFWICNANPFEFGLYVKDIYKKLLKNDQGALIPIDYRNLIFNHS